MAFKDEVRTIMREAAGGEPPAGDAWTRFERRARRSRAARATAVVMAAAAMVAVSLVAIPRLTVTNEGGFVAPNTDAPGPQESRLTEQRRIEPFENGVEFTDPASAVRFRYPPGWVEIWGGPGGSVTVAPEEAFSGGLHDGEQVDPRNVPSSFAFSVTPLTGSYEDLVARQRAAYELHTRDGARLTETVETLVAPLNAHEFTVSYPDTAPGDAASGWCRACVVRNWLVEWPNGTTVDVVGVARGDDAWMTYQGDLNAMVVTLEPYDEARHGRKGGFAGGVAQDDLSAALEAFLDARVRGRRAEDWLTSAMAEQLGREDLYVMGGDWYLSGWYVERREDADANSAEFVVGLAFTSSVRDPKPPTMEGIYERVIVGPGADVGGVRRPALVRTIEGCRNAACT